MVKYFNFFICDHVDKVKGRLEYLFKEKFITKILLVGPDNIVLTRFLICVFLGPP